MTAGDPVLAELRDMFARFEGPPTPQIAPRRTRPLRRLVLIAGILLALVVASVASADSFGVFDGGTPVSPAMKASIAAGEQGAPPALDPGIEAGTAERLITIPTEQGTVSLIVSRASRASYCMGLSFSWLGDKAGLGCNGPVVGPATHTPPQIDFGLVVPGLVGSSPCFVYGYVRPPSAATARLELADGTHRDIPLTDGFFLSELAATDVLERVEALDPSGTVLGTYIQEKALIGLPTKVVPC
jgi:hypothetical protein